jgi:hypothetical protein
MFPSVTLYSHYGIYFGDGKLYHIVTHEAEGPRIQLDYVLDVAKEDKCR